MKPILFFCCFFVWGSSFAQINTTAEELAPVFSEGGDSLFFVRQDTLSSFQYIYLSRRDTSGRWQNPEILPKPFNAGRYNALLRWVNFPQPTAWLANIQKGKKSRAGLSVTTLQNNTWTRPLALPLRLETTEGFLGFGWVNDTALVVAMHENQTNDDLFLFTLKNDTWQNQGSLPFNTDAQEFAPFWKNGTLFFASDRLGSMDIFSVEYQSDGTWASPEPMIQFNTDAFEAYLTINPKDGSLVFVRDGDLVFAIFEPQQERPSMVITASSPEPLTVFFDYNSTLLSDTSGSIMVTLGQWAAYLRNSPNKKILITGFTDAVGEETTNFTLSQRRAEVIAQLLKNREVPDNQIIIQAKGEKKARSHEQASVSDRKNDRRVELRLFEPPPNSDD